MSNATATRPATYEEKDAIRQPIEWDGLNCIMLGTVSKAGIFRRMDGEAAIFVPVERKHRKADPARLATFATSGKWLFEL